MKASSKGLQQRTIDHPSVFRRPHCDLVIPVSVRIPTGQLPLEGHSSTCIAPLGVEVCIVSVLLSDPDAMVPWGGGLFFFDWNLNIFVC